MVVDLVADSKFRVKYASNLAIMPTFVITDTNLLCLLCGTITLPVTCKDLIKISGLIVTFMSCLQETTG